jgi:sulfate adenylyltransferase subunit 1
VEHPARLGLNDIGTARLRLAEALPVDDYKDLRANGAFLVIDGTDGTTLAAGLVGTWPITPHLSEET